MIICCSLFLLPSRKRSCLSYYLVHRNKSLICIVYISGLQEYLNQQGFHTVGYGCTTCIGNSGELDESVAAAITDNGTSVFHLDLLFSSVCSKLLHA